MCMKYLGASFDIHGGGQDLIFPHHENEIAQSEAATGKPFASFWIQNGLVLLGGEKMSKSTKLFFLIEDICKVADPARCASTSSPPTSAARSSSAKSACRRPGSPWRRLQATAAALREAAGPPPRDITDRADRDGDLPPEIRGAIDRFLEALQDDFNSARAIGILFDLSRSLNRLLAQPVSGDNEDLIRQGQLVPSITWDALSVSNLVPKSDAAIPDAILKLAEERAEARRQRDWARADQFRQEILNRGYLVEDKAGREVRPSADLPTEVAGPRLGRDAATGPGTCDRKTENSR